MSTTNGHVRRLKDRVAIITGGGQGIGRTTALLFAEHGANIVIADVNEEQGEETVCAVEKAGGRAIFVKTNVAELDDAKAMAEKAHERFGRIVPASRKMPRSRTCRRRTLTASSMSI